MTDARKRINFKIIYAYIIDPLLAVWEVYGVLVSEVYRRYGIDKLDLLNGRLFITSVITGMTGYVATALPPSIIRFLYLKRGAIYGLEMYICTISSVIISELLVYLTTGIVANSVGLLGTLCVYCILSYDSTQPNTMALQMRLILTVITVAFPFATVSLLRTAYFPIWEAIVLCLIIHMHTAKDDSPELQQSVVFTTDSSSLNKSIAIDLVNIGLAHIGRNTNTTNDYLTQAIKDERRIVERPFRKNLSAKYKSEDQRKALRYHFMFFKEICLSLIFDKLLKDDKELLGYVKTELEARLQSGMSEAGGELPPLIEAGAS